MGTKWWCFLLFLRLWVDECLCLNLEGKALYALKQRVEVDPYGVLNNWDPQSSDPCSWSGVHCLAGQVEILNLTGMALVGTLMPEIGKLTRLNSLVLSRNNFHGAVPKEIGGLKMLELLDLRENKLSGEIPPEISDIPSLKHLMLCGNDFQDQVVYQIEEYEGVTCVNRKVDCVLRPTNGFLHAYGQIDGSNSQNLKQHNIMQHSQDPGNQFRRKLIQQIYNLPALLGNSDLPIIVPAQDFQIFTASGAFPASENSKKQTYITSSINNNPSSGVPIDLTGPFSQQPQQSNSKTPTRYFEKSKDGGKSGNGNPGKWFRFIYIPVSVFLIASIILATVVVCRRQGQTNIGPWRTGISGQLQKAFITGLSGQLRKAFVTGVPKLNKTELEVACEEFSNIINSEPDYTVFKGTLSNGTEIAVISTVIASPKDWSKSSESCFRRKIDMLSRVNHKNFVNLLGYCEEEDPFMRMMVLEYAPNGTLNDHLHIKEFEHLSWEVRMRIIIGMSYCLQHMHHELNPPVTLPYLQSNTVFLTDDYAAKLTDMSVWKEVIRKRNLSKDGDLDASESALADCAMNIYNFGLVLLEIISGKLPQQEDGGASLLNWASQYLNDGWNRKNLLDPTLKGFEEDQLAIICEVIKECVQPDSNHRPTMREITLKLRTAIDISPEAAYPRLSPLWWAELEILSVEAS